MDQIQQTDTYDRPLPEARGSESSQDQHLPVVSGFRYAVLRRSSPPIPPIERAGQNEVSGIAKYSKANSWPEAVTKSVFDTLTVKLFSGFVSERPIHRLSPYIAIGPAKYIPNTSSNAPARLLESPAIGVSIS